MLAIAEDMSQQGIRYHQHTAEWNKNMVKRILENTKYTRAGGYPQLVSDEDFATVQRQRTQRNIYAPLPTEIRPIKNKAVCVQCGGRMKRGTCSYGRVNWRCQSTDCGQVVTISDEALAKQVDERLHELAQAPQFLIAPEPEQTGADMETIRLRNELTLALNRSAESPEYVKTLALAVTARRYSQLPDPTPAYELEQLRTRLEQNPADTAMLTELLHTAVQSVRLTPNRNVELELVNGKLVAGTKEAHSV